MNNIKCDQFLECLKKIIKSNNNQNQVSNFDLKKSLNWSEDEFIKIRETLIANGIIKRGLGKGGKTILIKEKINRDIRNDIVTEDFINLLIKSKVIGFDQISYDFRVIKDIKNILDKNYGISVEIDSDNDCIRLNESEKSVSFFSDFKKSFIWSNIDDEIAANRLMDLFDWDELYVLSEETGKLIRKIVRIETGQDKKGTKFEIASTLIMKYGKDLFREKPQIFEAICKKLKIDAKKIRAGSLSAIKFVGVAGFPRSYAGEPTINQEPTSFYPKIGILPNLRDFQIEAKNSVKKIISNKSTKLILRMPTGTGKTRTGIECTNDWFSTNLLSNKKNVVFWIAHTEELCEQAISQFELNYLSTKERKFSVELFRLWGNYVDQNVELDSEQLQRITGSTNGNYILVSNNILFNRLIENDERVPWVHSLCKEANVLLVIDEAHRSGAETYKQAIDILYSFNPESNILGLTATPKRSAGTKLETESTQYLLNMFNEKIIDPFDRYEFPKTHLIENKILARPIFKEITTNFEVDVNDLKELEGLDISSIDAERIVNIEAQISDRVENWLRRRPVIEEIAKIASDTKNKIIYFGSCNLDSEMVAWGLRRYGISSEYLTADTSSSRRRKIISDFSNNKCQVLSNCMILTAGFDNPKITHVVVGRPTISTVLFEQMIGRGLRGPDFGGTESCEIIYVRDNIFPNPNIVFAYDKIKQDWDADLSGNNIDNKFKKVVMSDDVFNQINSENTEIKNDHEFKVETNVIEINKSNTVFKNEDPAEEIYQWLFNEMVHQQYIRANKIYFQFGKIFQRQINPFFKELSILLKRPIKSVGTDIILECDTGMAAALSSQKKLIISLINTYLIEIRNVG